MSEDTKSQDDGVDDALPVDLAERIVLHFDGVSKDGRRWFRCHCCSRDFLTAKPQDPQRDVGYGTCEPCHGWLHRGATPEARAAASQRFERYA